MRQDRSFQIYTKHVPTVIIVALTLLATGFFIFTWRQTGGFIGWGETQPPKLFVNKKASPIPTQHKTKPNRWIVPILPVILPKISEHLAIVTAKSPKVFAYAHGTVSADGKLFIGMADKTGNHFPANQIVIFNSNDISRQTLITIPDKGDIQTMVYDSVNDLIYFALSSNNALKIYSLNPHTYKTSTIISTSSINIGRKPAIVTDGIYIYGITNTDPSIVFRVKITDGALTISNTNHIPYGHSAAIGIYGSSTELYFGNGMLNEIEKADARTLDFISVANIDPCNISDDMPFVKMTPLYGHVYIGCEALPYGLRVKTDDMTFDRFSLPGFSLGLFIYGSNLYNAAQNGTIEVFPNLDLKNLQRYKIIGAVTSEESNGQDLQINEILYSPENDKFYFTAWWGVPGLYEVSFPEVGS